MKLVMIQGNHIASYEGRKQTALVRVDHWDFAVSEFIEGFRVSGPGALGDAA
jgi:hypothetical protein